MSVYPSKDFFDMILSDSETLQPITITFVSYVPQIGSKIIYENCLYEVKDVVVHIHSESTSYNVKVFLKKIGPAS